MTPAEALARHAFHRRLTLDLLRDLPGKALSYSPNKGQGPFWKQFRHVGRVQEDYLTALSARKMRFSAEAGTYRAGNSKLGLLSYLRRLDSRLVAAVKTARRPVDWWGEKVPPAEHLLRLSEHEVLHHGQWLVYLNGLKLKPPKSWHVWGY